MSDNPEGNWHRILLSDPFKYFSYEEKIPVLGKEFDINKKIKETNPLEYKKQETIMTSSLSEVLQNLPLPLHNWRCLINEDYQKKEKDYCLVKYKTDYLKVTNEKIETQFKEFLDETQKILKLVYGIYEKNATTPNYLSKKDHEPTHAIDYKIKHSKHARRQSKDKMDMIKHAKSQSKDKMDTIKHAESQSEDIMDMIKYVRNFQVIMMCEIYNFIKATYKDIKNGEQYTEEHYTILKKIIKKELGNFTKSLSTIYEIEKPLEEIILKESKIKYIYTMFQDYLDKIYLPYIDNAFKNLINYEKFNLFNVQYLMNLLLLKNKIFFHKKLDITYFDIEGKDYRIIEAHQNNINKINTILDNIDLFFKSLDEENNPQDIIEYGCKLLNITPDIFEKELKESLFFSNLLINEALISICPENYGSEIINSPASIFNFCEIIDEIPYTDNNKKKKIYGTSNDVKKYRMTCLEKYETMDYLAINSPLAKFMLFYWSPLMNSYLTYRAIEREDYNNVLIWGEDNILYDKKTRLLKEFRNRTTIEEIITKKIYLGYIKLTLSDNSILVIFIFLNSYFIELFDIYGTPIQYGNYYPYTFSTSQEIATHLFNKSIFNLVQEKKNKYYYLLLKAFINKVSKIIIPTGKKTYDDTENLVKHHTPTFYELIPGYERYWDPIKSETATWHTQKKQAPEIQTEKWSKTQQKKEKSETPKIKKESNPEHSKWRQQSNWRRHEESKYSHN